MYIQYGKPGTQEYVLASSEKLTSPQVLGYDFNQGLESVCWGLVLSFLKQKRTDFGVKVLVILMQFSNQNHGVDTVISLHWDLVTSRAWGQKSLTSLVFSNSHVFEWQNFKLQNQLYKIQNSSNFQILRKINQGVIG